MTLNDGIVKIFKTFRLKMPKKLKPLYLGKALDDLNKRVEEVKALGLKTKNVKQ